MGNDVPAGDPNMEDLMMGGARKTLGITEASEWTSRRANRGYGRKEIESVKKRGNLPSQVPQRRRGRRIKEDRRGPKVTRRRLEVAGELSPHFPRITKRKYTFLELGARLRNETISSGNDGKNRGETSI